MSLCIENKLPLLLVGPTGTGKSVYIKDKLMNQLDKSVYQPLFITFSAQTNSTQTQNLVMNKLEKRGRGSYGPRPGQRCIIFVDDLNMPALEKYGAQPPIELLRQLLDHGFWYSFEDTSKMKLKDIQFISAMGPPGGGRNPISTRLQRHVNLISITNFDDDTMTRIFSTIVSKAFKESHFPMDLQGMATGIVAATMSVYKSAIASLLPTPAKSHYTFNLRDFSRVISGVLLMDGKVAGDKNKLCRLWCHEVYRVFGDRLVFEEDHDWLFELLKETVKSSFKMSLDSVFAHVASPKGTHRHLSTFVFLFLCCPIFLTHVCVQA